MLGVLTKAKTQKNTREFWEVMNTSMYRCLGCSDVITGIRLCLNSLRFIHLNVPTFLCIRYTLVKLKKETSLIKYKKNLKKS